MMSLLTRNIKDILSIKIKSRHDGYTDQFTRIFMTKMFIISSIVMGVDWFHDTVACMVPKASDLSPNFVHSACWIQGFYIYPDMKKRMKDSGYYGIPENMNYDGVMSESGELCAVYQRASNKKNTGCNPMTKQYYLQYQWMPFYIASLALVTYMPYILFRISNTDMISLRTSMSADKIDIDEIVHNYFNYNINSIAKMRARIVINIFIKALYVIINVGAFLSTDALLDYNFSSYGVNWARWARLNFSTAHDTAKRAHPKPGNVLLPSFGFCEIHEASMDIRHVFLNKNKFICEISQNILYQYVLIVLWFVMVFSMMISIIGLLLNLLGHIITVACFLREGNPAKQIYKILTLRECEYLDFIRRKNIPKYGEVLRKLKTARIDMSNVKNNFDQTREPLVKSTDTLRQTPRSIATAPLPENTYSVS